jgi:hypothetical protein
MEMLIIGCLKMIQKTKGLNKWLMMLYLLFSNKYYKYRESPLWHLIISILELVLSHQLQLSPLQSRVPKYPCSASFCPT